MSKSQRSAKQQADDAAVDPVAAALAALDVARLAREEADAQEQAAVDAARAAGAAWSRIGDLYGLTKQGAQQRFKRPPSSSSPGSTSSTETEASPKRAKPTDKDVGEA